MATTATTRKGTNGGWRKLSIGLLVLFGCVALALAVIGSWTRGLVFNTEEWVETVAPLPKDDTVSQALAVYGTEQAFKGVDVESEIKAALPPAAAFLAAPLSTELQERTEKRTQQFVQSDQFQSVWASVNRFAHERLVNFIDRGPREAPENVQLKLQSVATKAREISGRTGAQSVFTDPDFKFEKFRKVRDILKNLKDSPAVMPALAALLLVGALAVSRRRWHTLLVVGGGVALTGVALRLGIKGGRPEVMDLATGSLNQSAVGVIWDQITMDMVGMANWMISLGVAALILSMVAGPYRDQSGFATLSRSKVAGWIATSRDYVGRHALIGRVLGIAVFAAALLAAGTVTWLTIVAGLFWLGAYLLALNVVAVPRRT